MMRAKKILAIMLSASMMLGAMPVNAANSTQEQAEVLHYLNLFDGISTTSFDPDLDGDATREQAMKMIAVALDWDINMGVKSDFVDVSDWAQPYVVAAVKAGVTNGIGRDRNGDELFGAGEDVTLRQLLTWFDRVLTDSDTAWEDNADKNNTVGISRGTLVTETYKALMETPEGEDESLIEAIVGDDDKLKDIATEAGMIEEDKVVKDTTEPTLTDVEITDDDEIVLTFSEAIDEDSAEDDDNYVLYADKEVEDAFDDIELTDTKEVTIKFEDDLDGEYVIVADGVEDLAGNEMYDYKSFDTDEDDDDEVTIDDVEVTGDDEIVITFTGDLDEDSAERESRYTLFDDDDDEVEDAIEKAELTDEDEVTITFSEDIDGEYTIEVDGVDDEDGNDIDDTYEFDTDDSSVSIKSVEVTEDDEIVITFSDDVDESSAERESKYTLYDEDDDEVDDAIEKAELTDDDEVTITFSDDLDEDDYTIEVDGVEDEDGNDISDSEEFEVDEDTGEIESIEVKDEDELVITFTVDVDADSAEREAFYTIYDDDQDEQDIIDEVEQTGDDEVTITLEEDLDDGEYTIEVENVEDEDGDDVEGVIEFIVGDGSDDDDDDDEPGIKDIDIVDDDEIVITFTDDVTESTAEDEDNYTLYDEDNDKVSDSIFERIKWTDDDEVTITFESNLDNEEYTIDVDGVETEDEEEIDDREDFDMDDRDSTSPTIEDIEVESTTMIVVTFSEDLDEDEAVDEDNYTLYDEDGNEEDEDIFGDFGLTDDDEVTILFSEELSGSYTLEVDGVEDESGNDVNDTEEFEIDDEEPTIKKIELEDEDRIVITFSEDVDEDSAEKISNYTLYDEDGDKVDDDIFDDITMTDDDEVTIDFDEDLDSEEYTIEVEGVEDESGNESDDKEDFDMADLD